jgi:hypothetical protein
MHINLKALTIGRCMTTVILYDIHDGIQIVTLYCRTLYIPALDSRHFTQIYQWN